MKIGISVAIIILIMAFFMGCSSSRTAPSFTAAAAIPFCRLPDGWKFGQALPENLPQIRMDESWHLVRPGQAAGKWQGPEDLSLVMSHGWNEDGLYFCFEVADSDVRNEQKPANLWRQDCIELFLAPPKDTMFQIGNAQADRLQLLLAPPDEAGTVRKYAYCPAPVELGLLQTRGERTADGYRIELFVPAAMLGLESWRENDDLRMQVFLDDCDKRDGSAWQARVMSIGGIQGNFSASPADYLPVRLWRTMPQGREILLDPSWHVTVSSGAKITIEAAPLGDCIAAELIGDDGKSVSMAILPPKGGEIDVPKNTPNGLYRLKLVPHNAGGALGVRTFQVPVLNQTISALTKVDFAKLAKHDPWRACNYLALASTVEYAKVAMGQQKSEKNFRLALAEIACRQALLNNKPLPEDTDELRRLLELTRGFKAQIAVEFSRSNRQFLSTITIPWGDFPLVNAQIYDFPTPEAAQAELEFYRELCTVSKDLALTGADAAFIGSGHLFSDGIYHDLIPDEMVTLALQCAPRKAFRMSFAEAVALRPEAIVITAKAPASMRKQAQEWARQERIPQISLAERGNYRRTLIAGTIPANEFTGYWHSRYGVSTDSIWFRRGRLLFQTTGTPRELGMEFAKFILAGKPLTPELADKFRHLRAETLPEPDAAAKSAASELWVGDPHTHTIHSDGAVTPAGLLLQAPYAGLSFIVISDHNVISGAQAAEQAGKQAGYRFPVVVGEEITTMKRFHLNIYPLTKQIDCNLPLAEMAAAAKRQGAVVQLNHPMTYGTTLKRYWFGGGNTVDCPALDAVERNVGNFERWRQENRLPVFTGATDSHMGIFGHLDSTVIRTKNFSGAALAEAVRTRRAAMLTCALPDYIYGDKAMRCAVGAALRMPEATLHNYRQRLEKFLNHADIAKYISLSPARWNGVNWSDLIDQEKDRVDFE